MDEKGNKKVEIEKKGKKKESTKEQNESKYINFDPIEPKPEKKKGYQGKSFAPKPHSSSSNKQQSSKEDKKEDFIDKNNDSNKKKKIITIKKKNDNNNVKTKSSTLAAKQISIYNDKNYSPPAFSNKEKENMSRLNKELVSSFEKLKKQKDYLRILEHRQRLPSYKMRNHILNTIKQNQVTVVVGGK